MKDFLKRILIFFVVAFFGLNVLGYLRVQPVFIQYMNNRKGGWLKVYERINRSNTNLKTKRVYIGDSVGNQLFDIDKTPNSLTSNAAVSLVGNFILINNFINNNPNLEEVVLVSVPNDIGWNFEQKLTHNNFVKPFLTFNNLRYFDEVISSKLWKKPQSWLYLFFGVKVLPFSDIDFSERNSAVNANYLEEIKLTTLSDIAISYIQKLDDLCRKNSIKLIIISPPVPQHWLEDSDDWSEMREQIQQHNLTNILGDYINSVVYYPDDYFYDGLHLKKKFIKDSKENILEVLD